MTKTPWKEWIPGVLSKNQVEQLCKESYISNYSDSGPQIDYSSIDLHLSNEGYGMIEGAIKPSGPRYNHILNKNMKLARKLSKDENGYFLLKSKETYIFKIKEEISLGDCNSIYGLATAKSTIGRMDVLVRLIVDGVDRYDYCDPDGLKRGNGNMYVEITPITFHIFVKENIPVTQLRLFWGRPEDCELKGLEIYHSILLNSSRTDGTLSVDLTPTKINGYEVSAFSANVAADNDDPIILWKNNKRPNPCNHWKFLKAEPIKGINKLRLLIEKDAFYILRSKERISLPGGVAVYCRAMDETFGEMRIHYAGFVHPFFGKNRSDKKDGTPLIFEVRGHDVNVSLCDDEPLAKLIFYRMSEDSKFKKPVKMGNNIDLYNEQTLQLSGIFDDWPKKIKIHEDGRVEEL